MDFIFWNLSTSIKLRWHSTEAFWYWIKHHTMTYWASGDINQCILNLSTRTNLSSNSILFVKAVCGFPSLNLPQSLADIESSWATQMHNIQICVILCMKLPFCLLSFSLRALIMVKINSSAHKKLDTYYAYELYMHYYSKLASVNLFVGIINEAFSSAKVM